MSLTANSAASPSRERVYQFAMSGWVMLVVILAVLVVGVLLNLGRVVLIGAPLVALGIFLAFGFVVLQPNASAVLTLFGRYKGTLRRDGFHWVNPLFSAQRISLRIRNFTTPTLKVNDKGGNPIEVAAVAVWYVRDSAQAAFDVDDYETYITTQVEVALRDVVSTHPYDAKHDDELSLRGNAPAIADLLMQGLQNVVDVAGLAIKEMRITHLAYAPEIASIMLRRQQAEALIQAREKMVDGAIGMVQMALKRFKESGPADLSASQQAALVTNMMTVLLSESGAQPVIPTVQG